MPDLDQISRIVVVMMENRSFDHLLGYLSLPQFGRRVDGVRDTEEWRNKAASNYNGALFPPFALDDPYDLMKADPPHERSNIALQMGKALGETFPMNGFVWNYAGAQGSPFVQPGDTPPVMGYFMPEQVPVTAFLADNFAVCDRWFSSLPAGTQPNRLMAMAGCSKIEVNTFPLPSHNLVYSWLEARKVRWRVYHEGMPFFAMMPEWLPDILQERNFRPLTKLFDDVQNEPPDEFPQVVFIEPTYTDAPHLGLSTDDHAPSAVKGGQQFLLEAYRAMTLVPDLWSGTVMIITYDEHGGFFDHVTPPSVKTKAPLGINYPDFETLGVRVPGLVVSPFVKPGTVFSSVLDHTSILKFIAQKFGGGAPYSSEVAQRRVGSVFDVLNLEQPRDEIPVVQTLNDYMAKDPGKAGYLPDRPPPSTIAKGFKQALDTIRNHPAKPPGKFDDLLTNFPE